VLEINFKNLENIFDDQISIEDDEVEKPNPTANIRLKINDPANTKDQKDQINLVCCNETLLKNFQMMNMIKKN
jgi:hypothetical protein